MKSNTQAILALLCLAGGPVLAANDPADAAALVPPVKYQSPFAQYRVLGEDRNTPWKEANDTVRAIGGWRAYAKEAAEAAKAGAAGLPSSAPAIPAIPATPAAPSASPPAQPHKHGG